MRFWKLTIIKVLVGFIGGFIMCFLLVKPTIHKAIDKETTKNEIAIRKIKKPQDLSVVLSPECIPKPINENDVSTYLHYLIAEKKGCIVG